MGLPLSLSIINLFPLSLPPPHRKRKYSEITHKVLNSEDSGNIDWNDVDPDGNTPLMVAMIRRHLNKVQAMLDKGQTILTTRNEEGRTILMLALDSHQRTSNNLYAFKISKIIQNIVTLDPSVVNVKSRCGYTPLRVCEDVELCRFLIESGAKVNLRDCDRETATFHALFTCNYEKLELLLNNGAHLNMKNKLGNTVLVEATNRRYSTKYAELLIKHGADLSSRHINLMSIVGLHSSNETLKLLLKSGLDVDSACWSCGSTLLHLAVRGGRHCMMPSKRYLIPFCKIGILLVHGADTSKRNADGYSAYDYFIEPRNCSYYQTWWNYLKNVGKLDTLLMSASYPPTEKTSFLQQFMTDVPSASDLLQDVAGYLGY